MPKSRLTVFLIQSFVGMTLTQGDVQAQGSVTGKVTNPDGTTITNGVTVQAWCTNGGALAGTKVSDGAGRFTLSINNAYCPSGNTTVYLTFQRHGTAAPPQLTVPPGPPDTTISATATTNLGNLKIPN